MDAATLAATLAARLSEVLPDGFVARAQGNWVSICPPNGFDVWVGIAQDLGEPAGYECAAGNVLSVAQDVVSETTAMPWPRECGERLNLALPGSTVRGGVLHLWYGGQDEPVLRLRSIELTP